MNKLTEKQAWLHIAKLFEESDNGVIDGRRLGVCYQIEALRWKCKISVETETFMIEKVGRWKPINRVYKYVLFKAPLNAEGAKWRAKMCKMEANKL